MGTSSTSAICARASATQARPAATVERVPPFSWITSVVTGRPVAAICSCSLLRLKPSQPSDTRSTAPTLGCVVSRSSIIAP